VTHPSLDHTAHRPWPVPPRPWSGRQIWHDLAFLHWPVPVTVLRHLVPEPLVVQEYQSSAWVGVIPFWMSGVTLRGVPALPGLSTFPELNVRTYVTLQDRPGVWFFSLDAANWLAVRAARLLYHLPYMDARMRVSRTGDRIHYRSERPTGERFEADYQPIGPIELARPGTLQHWLTERYCLYARSGSGRLYRAEVHHEPWPLQPARVYIARSDLLQVHGISVDGPPPQVLFARRLEVAIWTPDRLPRR